MPKGTMLLSEYYFRAGTFYVARKFFWFASEIKRFAMMFVYNNLAQIYSARPIFNSQYPSLAASPSHCIDGNSPEQIGSLNIRCRRFYCARLSDFLAIQKGVIVFFRIASRKIVHALLIALLAAPVYAAEPDDKDLTILQLQKIIAEQSMGQLLENEKVREYARIRAAYDKVLKEIAEKEKAKEKDR